MQRLLIHLEYELKHVMGPEIPFGVQDHVFKAYPSLFYMLRTRTEMKIRMTWHTKEELECQSI